MMKNIALAFGLVVLATSGLAIAGDTVTKTEDSASADGTSSKHVKKSKKKNADGTTTEKSTETKTETK